jgi:hypothetical protein
LWIYATIGVVVGTIVLGAIAIDTAINQNKSSEWHATVLTEKERTIIRNSIQATESYEEVKREIDNSLDYSVKYQKLNNNIGQVILITKEPWTIEPLDGNFTNGYRQTLREKTITVDVDRVNNTVLSVKTKSDIVDVVMIEFNENQRKIIAMSLADIRVKELLTGKDYYIVQVRERGVGFGDHCPEMECALVGFDLVSSPRGVLMATILNPKSGEILDVRAGEGWR